MASNLEQRVFRLEQEIQLLQQQIAGLLAAIAALQANQWAPIGGGGGGGGGAAVYVCMAPAGLAASWSGSAPTAGSGASVAAVYQVSGLGTIMNLGTQTVVNWLPSVTQAKASILIPDGAGNYAIVSQSCT